MDEYHYLSLLDEAIVTSPTGFTSKAHFSLWKPKEEGFKQNEEEKSGIVPNESDSDVFEDSKDDITGELHAPLVTSNTSHAQNSKGSIGM